MLARVQQLHQILQHLGPDWLTYRLSYAARLRTGALRRKMPASSWNEQTLDRFLTQSSLGDSQKYFAYRLENAPRFFFAPDHRDQYQHYFAQWDTSQTPISSSEALGRGLIRFFEHTEVQTGFPPDWHANAITGERAPDKIHWSEIGDFNNGDIKVIWEPSRFG